MSEEGKYFTPILIHKEDLRAFTLAVIVCFFLVGGLAAVLHRPAMAVFEDRVDALKVEVDANKSELKAELESLGKRIDQLDAFYHNLKWDTKRAPTTK